jgi:hypothetical protein
MNGSRLLGMWRVAAVFAVGGWLLSGCGSPPQAGQPTQGIAPTPAAQAGRAAPPPAVAPPRTKASATWGDAMQLVAYDAKPLGGDQYRLILQYKCLKPTTTEWSSIIHPAPTKPTGLENEFERRVGVKVWDRALEPPSTTWEPGKTYITVAEGRLPSAGAPWTIVLGMVERTQGAQLREVAVTDPGTLQLVPKTQWLRLPTQVGK